MIEVRENLTPREQMLYEQEKEMFRLQAQHAVKVKEIDIEAIKLESKFAAWLRLPLKVLYLPVSLLLVLVLVVYAIRGKEPPKALVELIKP